MTRFRLLGFALALVAAVLASCDNKGIKRPAATSIVVVNAAPSYGDLTFVREERDNTSIGVLPFGTAAAASFDSGQYDFNVDYVPPDGTPGTRLATVSTTLSPDSRYIFVLSETATGLTPFVVEEPTPQPTGSNAETIVVNAAEATGSSYDVYLEPPGTDLAAVSPLGTLAYRENLAPTTRAEGDYRLYLTAPGTPTDVRFESTTFTLPAGTSSVIAIKDEGGVGVGTLDVVFFGTSTALFRDVHVQSSLRVINAIADMTARDMTLDAAYTPPVFPDVAYATASDYVDVPAGAADFSVTPVGNPVEELTQPLTLNPGIANTVLISGNTTDGLTRVGVSDDLRRRAGQYSLRLMNGASELGAIEFFLTPPGVTIDEIFYPVALLGAPGIIDNANLSWVAAIPAGDYELTLRDQDTQAVVAGPVPVTFENDKKYEILAVDAVGGSTADLVFLGDFN